MSPTGFTATAGGVDLAWHNNSPSAEEVVVLRATGGSASYPYLEVAHLASSTASYRDPQVPGGYHSYRIKAPKPGVPAGSSIAIDLHLQEGCSAL